MSVSPDKKPPPRARSRRPAPVAKLKPDASDPYQVVYFKRHEDDDPAETAPGQDFLRGCPPKVAATFAAVLTQVAAAPPHRFAGGGKWEAMHGTLAGFHEVRVDGPNRRHYRLFCRLDTQADGLGPLLVVLTGSDKAFRTTFPDSVYADVAALGAEYLARNPRSLA